MALGVYKFGNGTGEISHDGSYSTPIQWEVALAGGTLEAKFFLRMESPTEYLTDGVLFAQDALGPDESDWFSFAADEGGGPGVYASTFEFELPLGSEMAVWIRVDVPTAIEVEPKDDIKVVATYIRHEI